METQLKKNKKKWKEENKIKIKNKKSNKKSKSKIKFKNVESQNIVKKNFGIIDIFNMKDSMIGIQAIKN